MPKESQVEDRAKGRSPRTWTERVAFFVVPVALVTASYALLFAETGPPAENLQITAPDDAAPGETVGLRALFYTHLGEPGDVRTERIPVTVVLIRGPDDVVAKAELAASRVDGAEGAITVPKNAKGELELVATARFEDETVVVRRPLFVHASPRRTTPRPRAVSKLMDYTVLESSWDDPVNHSAAPDLFVDVSAGGCVPESTCVLVPRGEPEGAVWERPTSSAFEVQSVTGPGVTLGVVHGPEAEVTFAASYADGRRLRLRVRLPVILGGVSFARPTTVPAPAAELSLFFGPAWKGQSFVFDAFRDGRFGLAGSFTVDDDGRAHLGAPLPAGRWRIQVRKDPYGVDSATTAVVDVVESDPMGIERGPGLELDVMDLPEAVGSRAQAGQATARRVTIMRWLVFVTFTLSAFFVSFLLLYGGLNAAREARALLASAEQAASPNVSPSQPSPRVQKLRKLRSMLDVVGLTLLVFLAITAAALLLVVRGLF